MLRPLTIRLRRFRHMSLLIVQGAIIIWFVQQTAAAVADDSVNLVRVEEDWELVVGDPDPDSNGPQVTCTLSTTGDIRSLHASFDLNFQESPTYAAGGLQLQVWNAERMLFQKGPSNNAVFSTSNETVSWTQSMELNEGRLTFQVSNGSSSTWGTFGNGESLKLTFPVILSNLNGYQPGVSVKNSGIGYASNRVKSLTLQRVRYILSTGDQYEDTQATVVYPRTGTLPTTN